MDMVINSDDEIFFAGEYRIPGHTYVGDPYVAKMDTNGNMIPPYGWIKVLSNDIVGGTNFGITIDDNGQIYTTGCMGVSAKYPNKQAFFILRMNPKQRSGPNIFTNITSPYYKNTNNAYRYWTDPSYNITLNFLTSISDLVITNKDRPGYVFK